MSAGNLVDVAPWVICGWEDDSNPASYSPGSHTKVRYRCQDCGIARLVEVRRLWQRSCPYCSHKIFHPLFSLSSRCPQLLSMFSHGDNPLPPSLVHYRQRESVTWVCYLGHRFRRRVEVMEDNNSCPQCPQLLTANAAVAGVIEFWSEENVGLPENYALSSNVVMSFTCGEHEWESQIRQQVDRGGCPYCLGYRTVVGVNDPATRFPWLLEHWAEESPLSEATARREYRWRCVEGHEFRRRLHSVARRGLNCPQCQPLGSRLEDEVSEFVAGVVGAEVIRGDREILDGRELDIVIPDLRVAIEVNGDYWHSDEAPGRNPGDAEVYHRRKYADSANSGYGLAFLWESQWRGDRCQAEDELRRFLAGEDRIYLLSMVPPGEVIPVATMLAADNPQPE